MLHVLLCWHIQQSKSIIFPITKKSLLDSHHGLIMLIIFCCITKTAVELQLFWQSWFWAAVALFDAQRKRQSTSTFLDKLDTIFSSGCAKKDWSLLTVLLHSSIIITNHEIEQNLDSNLKSERIWPHYLPYSTLNGFNQRLWLPILLVKMKVCRRTVISMTLVVEYQYWVHQIRFIFAQTSRIKIFFEMEKDIPVDLGTRETSLSK